MCFVLLSSGLTRDRVGAHSLDSRDHMLDSILLLCVCYNVLHTTRAIHDGVGRSLPVAATALVCHSLRLKKDTPLQKLHCIVACRVGGSLSMLYCCCACGSSWRARGPALEAAVLYVNELRRVSKALALNEVGSQMLT